MIDRAAPARSDESRSPRREIVLRPATIVTAVAIAAGVVLALLFVYETRRVLIWAMIALFLALALDHVAAPLQRRLSRTQASLAAFALLVGLIAAIALVLAPPLADQANALFTTAPDTVQTLSQGRGPLGFLERRFDVVERTRAFVDKNGLGSVLGAGQPLFSIVSTVATGIVGSVSVLFLTLFMLIHGPAWRRAALELAPQRQRGLWTAVFDDVRRAIGGWVIGAGILAVAAGTVAGILLFVLGAPYPVALALVVGVLDPVPFIGATLAAAVVSVVVLAANGLTYALIVAGFFLLYQQVVENHVLVPLVYGRTVQVSALGVLLSVLLGGELAGVVGAIAAIPIVGALKSTLGHLLEYRRRGRLVEPHPRERLHAELAARNADGSGAGP